MGSSESKTSSQTEPWAPTIPGLQTLIGDITGQMGNFQPTGAENNAIQQLMKNAGSMFNFGPQVQGMAQSFMGGDPNNLLQSGLSSYQKQMNPIANASLDPTKTPGMANVLSTIQNDVSGNVNSQFAGAGRDLSGMNMQTLARGISQGEAAPLLGQYNQNVANRQNAANGLFSASGATNSAMDQNKMAGLGMAQAVPSFMNAGPMQQLAAAGMQRSLPLQNLAQLEGLMLPISGLGQQGQSTTTSTPSFMQDLLMGSNVFKNFGFSF